MVGCRDTDGRVDLIDMLGECTFTRYGANYLYM